MAKWLHGVRQARGWAEQGSNLAKAAFTKTREGLKAVAYVVAHNHAVVPPLIIIPATSCDSIVITIIIIIIMIIRVGSRYDLPTTSLLPEVLTVSVALAKLAGHAWPLA